MNRDEVYARLKEVFQDVFDKEVALTDATTAADVPGWDSLNHITLIGTIEDEFDIKFPMKDVVHMKNVGELVDKIIAAGNFNQGFTTGELCAASILDMKWHELDSVEGVDVNAFEQKVCAEMGLVGEIIPRYRSTYFNHIFGSSGYSAGYYSYLWAEVLDKDAFELFRQKGIFDKETAMSFRHNVLEMGGSEEPMVLYKRFRGADPDSGALLRARGLK